MERRAGTARCACLNGRVPGDGRWGSSLLRLLALVRGGTHPGATAKAYTSAVSSSSNSCSAAQPIMAPLRSITTKLLISVTSVCRDCGTHRNI
jgi:hypothetical protein